MGGEVSTEQVYREQFEKYDRDGNGSISKEEMKAEIDATNAVLKAHAGCTDEDLSRRRAKANEVFAEMDLNADGTISFEEFKKSFEKP